MRLKHLIIVVLLMVLCAGLGAAGPASAQGTARTIPIPGELITVKTSPDGRLAAVYEVGQSHDPAELIADYLPVRLVDLDSEAVTPLPGPADYAVDVAFSPDGATLAGCYGGGQIVLWDTTSGKQRQSIPILPGITRCAFLPDGQTLAVTSPVGTLSAFLLLDTASGAIPRILSYRFETFGQFRDLLSDPNNFSPYALAAFAITPDGSQIVTSAQNDNLWLWGMDGTPPTLFRESEETLPMLSIRKLAVTPDDSAVVYLNQAESTVHALRLADGEEVASLSFDDRPYTFALAPDGDRLVLAYRDTPSITVTRLSQPDSRTTLDLPGGADLSFPAVAFATSSRVVVTGMNTSNTDQNALYVLDVP